MVYDYVNLLQNYQNSNARIGNPWVLIIMIANIQVLRAFAAINVVLYHIIGTAESYSQGTAILDCIRGWGANGVDLFFVISGFVMLHTQKKNSKSPKSFLLNRLLRIAPIYWLLTLFVVILYILVPSLFRQLDFSIEWLSSSLFFLSFVFGYANPVVYLGWTLELEMLFYVIFAATLYLDKVRSMIFVNAVVLLGVALIFEKMIILEFFLGMIISLIYWKYKILRTHGLFLLMIGSALLSASIFIDFETLGYDRFFVWGVPAFFIVLGAVYSKQVKNPAILFLGDASYSIYLMQMFTIPAFYKISSSYLTDLDGDVLALLCLMLSIATGCFVYFFLEKKINNAARYIFIMKNPEQNIKMKLSK